jgi:putative ABC transport system ATP-binding protein
MSLPSAYPPGEEGETGPAPLVGVRNLDRAFEQGGGSVYALRRIEMDVAPGEFVSIMGPSGAGKSTLLHVLALHDAAWTGEYRLDGHLVQSLSRKQRQQLQRGTIGFVFQSYHLLDDLTVAENLDVPLSYRDVPRTERQARVAETLDRFGIVGRKDLYPRQLSGGQQQLVAVARAVIAQPRLVLADEPTGNLHSDQAREVMELFRKLNEQGTTIVQVTHSEQNAAYGDRVVRLRDGWVVD